MKATQPQPALGLRVRTKVQVGLVTLYRAVTGGDPNRMRQIVDLVISKPDIDAFNTQVVGCDQSGLCIPPSDPLPIGRKLMRVPTLNGYPQPDSWIEGYEAIIDALK